MDRVHGNGNTTPCHPPSPHVGRVWCWKSAYLGRRSYWRDSPTHLGGLAQPKTSDSNNSGLYLYLFITKMISCNLCYFINCNRQSWAQYELMTGPPSCLGLILGRFGLTLGTRKMAAATQPHGFIEAKSEGTLRQLKYLLGHRRMKCTASAHNWSSIGQARAHNTVASNNIQVWTLWNQQSHFWKVVATSHQGMNMSSDGTPSGFRIQNW